MNNHIGSDFDDFLREEGILAKVETAAGERVSAFQSQPKMELPQLTKSATESFKQGWKEALRGETSPISELWAE
jgi:hypothetical protein